MPDFVAVPDPNAGAAATGRIRYELRQPSHPTAAAPLVLIGGMTQTLASWGGQLRPLSERRPVLAYEARGQGTTELSLHDASLPVHVQDLVNLLQALALPPPIDVCGFSFGGRVALAVAAKHPTRVRRLVLTGVGADRSVLSQCIVAGWKASLKTGDLEALARVSLPDIVGPRYLEANAAIIEPMIKAVVQRNTLAGIEALFRDTIPADPDDAWGPMTLAGAVQCPALVLGGNADRLAPPAQVRTLAAAVNGVHRIFADVGHTVPIEAALPWRQTIETFLDSPPAGQA